MPVLMYLDPADGHSDDMSPREAAADTGGGSWRHAVLGTEFLVGGAERLPLGTHGTSFRWGDNPGGAVTVDPEQGQRAAARADLAQAGRAVQRLGRAATPESIKPHLKRFTVEQIEDILGRQRGVESAPESE